MKFKLVLEEQLLGELIRIMDVDPDISTWAKSMGSGMPIGAVIGKQEVMDAAAPGTIGGTYIGNPIACAASLATIKYMEDIDLNGKGKNVGDIIRKRFEDLKKKHSEIGEVRGLGAMIAMEFVKDNDPQQPDYDLCYTIGQRLCKKRFSSHLSRSAQKCIENFIIL